MGHSDNKLELMKKYQVDLENRIPLLVVLFPPDDLPDTAVEFDRTRVMTEEDRD